MRLMFSSSHILICALDLYINRTACRHEYCIFHVRNIRYRYNNQNYVLTCMTASNVMQRMCFYVFLCVYIIEIVPVWPRP